MKNRHLMHILMIISLPFLYLNYACDKEDEEKAGPTDTELYNMAKDTAGFVWYKFSDSLLGKSSGSGHSQPYLRTRFNSTAATKLDSSGKVIAGAVFPENSLVVKELLEGKDVLALYAILYKQTGHNDADSRGWVWGYINSDGSVREPASKKGEICIGCHSQSGNIDYMLMNKYFP